MLVVELVLGAAVIALIATNIRDKKLLKENKQLVADNSAISEFMLVDSDDSFIPGHKVPHKWAEKISEDTIYVSKSPVSFDRVVLTVTRCERCKMVHRYISQGLTLARKKGLLEAEGFYHGGVKVADHGCIQDNVAAPEVIDVEVDNN
jgi:hypothetical protein